MATNDLYGWFPTMSQPLTAPPSNRWTIPEQAPGAQPLTDRTAPNISTNFSMGPLSQLAYQMAGSPKRGPLKGGTLPPAAGYDDSGNDSGGAGGSLLGAFGGLGGLGNAFNSGGSPYSSIFGGFGSTGGPLDNVPIGVISDDPRTGGISGNLPNQSDSSSALSNAASGALGAYNLYSGIQQGGQAGASQALLGAGKLAGAIGSSSALGSTALGSSLAASGAATALPLAGIGFAVADYLNSGPLNDDKSKTRNLDAFTQATGARMVELPLGRTAKFYYAMPDGTLLDSSTFNDLAGSWYGATYAPDGNQADWQAKYDEFSKNLQPATLPKGYAWDAAAGKIVRG